MFFMVPITDPGPFVFQKWPESMRPGRRRTLAQMISNHPGWTEASDPGRRGSRVFRYQLTRSVDTLAR
ncbi:hypothetical protein GCM10009619_15250 [Williamsia maris]